MKFRILSLLFCIVITVPAVAQDRLTPELLWQLGRLGDYDLSPDGKTVVYSVRRFNIETNKGYNTLYTIPATGGNPTIVADSSDKAFAPRWSNDGKRLYFLSSKNGAPQIWVMNADGSGKKQVTLTPSPISNFAISPTGDKVWYTREIKITPTVVDRNPDLPLTTGRIYDDLMFRHWDQWEDENFSHVFWAPITDDVAGTETDLMTNEPYDSPLAPFGSDKQITWSPDGKFIAYTCKKLTGSDYALSTNSDIYLYDLTGKTTTNLTEGMQGYDTYPAYPPDGKSITWLSMETPMYEADRNRIFRYDFTTNTKTELTAGFDYTVESYSWSQDGSALYFLCGINATEQLWTYDFATTDSLKRIRRITNDVADITGFAHAGNGKKTVMVTASMSISSPSELFIVNVTTGKNTPLTKINTDALKNIQMGKVEKRMIKATDGKEILTWVILPPDFDPKKKYPALLYCQGGPQSTVSQFFSYRWNFQLMAANGYVVVAPNRRGLPSFGTEWNRQISGDWGGQAMNDLLSAIDSVSNEPFVDKERLGAVGASFGGYSVYWLAGNHQKRFRSFLSHCGVYNLESMYGTTEELFFVEFDMGAPYTKQASQRSYFRFNPLRYAQLWDTPIMVIHNDLDFRVPVSQGMEAFTIARRQGLKARFLSFPDENHWVLKPQNSLLWHREFFRWLDETLKN